jgi:phosphoenolpyruvate synthase/pyruvate phosphate dikinase
VVKTARSPLPIIDVHPFVEIEENSRQPEGEIGALSVALQTFHKRGLPTPTAWVLPVPTLTKIAQENHLFQVLELEFSALNLRDHQQCYRFSQDIAQHIQNMVLPNPVEKGFQKLFDHWLDHQFVAVRPSFVSQGTQPEHLSALHIQGEANIIESLLQVWAKLYLPEFLPARLEEWKKGIKVPAALVIQLMVNAESSGVGIYSPASSRRSSQVTIFSQWGVTPELRELFQQGDWYEVDAKTWEIKQRHVGVKRKEWVRRLDRLHQQDVQRKLQSHPSLTPQGAVALAKLVMASHKGQMGSYIVDWAAATNAAYILDIRPFQQQLVEKKNVYFLPTAEQLKSFTPSQASTKRFVGPTATKVMVSIGKLDHLKGQVAGADGVGLLRAEWAYNQLGVHPFHLLKTGKSERIRNQLTELILSVAQSHNEDFPILFRSQNFTTNELKDFPHGKEYEPDEVNPYLGYRGALRIIHDYTLFDIELDALQDAHLEGVQNLGLMVPFIRNHSELAILLHHFAKPEFATQRFLKLWMQANTPENLFDLQKYCMPGLSGISLNIQSIHSLLHGVDPDNIDVFQLYPINHHQIHQLLRMARSITHDHQIQLVLQLEQYDQKLIEFAAELGYDGVTVPAKDVHRARQHIIETEHQQILG